MPPTIFSQMIAGHLPCHCVYEDGQVFAFLDANPVSKGHTVLVPKEAVATMMELSETSAAALGQVLPRLSRALLHVTGAPALHILQNNGAEAHQTIEHVHFHLIPKYADGAGLIIPWQTLALNDETAEELSAVVRYQMTTT